MRKVMICLFLVASVAFLPACKEETPKDAGISAADDLMKKGEDAKNDAENKVNEAAETKPGK